MAYLTYEEYTSFGYEDVDATEFSKLVEKAGDFMDLQTRNFYKINPIDEDPSDFRRTKFKKAVALQIDYMHQVGATTASEMSSPQSWSVDGMSVSTGGSGGDSGSSTSIISKDSIWALSGTGLLYRGVG
ncbi:hypothetical protein [Enterococcus diestrammenae]|uniref:hypothetical protein n=1 Tax=Enterococcus diestrammenae TaxID=1155073 RepID=UPI0022E03449|nr:hypothetical protein [Enterococcus diestrammenae]